MPYHKHALALLSVLCCINVYAQPIGIFDESSDVGAVLIKGKSVYRPSGQQYTISGAGANIWFASDQFQFLWKKLSGDFMLHARAGFLGKGTDPHRKTGWMIRSALDSNAAMISATVHGDGLTSLQYRKSKGGNVEEVRSLMKGPGIIQLQRKGNTFIMSVAADGDTLQQQQVSVEFPDNVFAGLFVCSHNKDIVETVVFDNVRIARPARDQFVPYREYIGSHVELMDITTGIRDGAAVQGMEPVSDGWSGRCRVPDGCRGPGGDVEHRSTVRSARSTTARGGVNRWQTSWSRQAVATRSPGGTPRRSSPAAPRR